MIKAANPISNKLAKCRCKVVAVHISVKPNLETAPRRHIESLKLAAGTLSRDLPGPLGSMAP